MTQLYMVHNGQHIAYTQRPAEAAKMLHEPATPPAAEGKDYLKEFMPLRLIGYANEIGALAREHWGSPVEPLNKLSIKIALLYSGAHALTRFAHGFQSAPTRSKEDRVILGFSETLRSLMFNALATILIPPYIISKVVYPLANKFSRIIGWTGKARSIHGAGFGLIRNLGKDLFKKHALPIGLTIATMPVIAKVVDAGVEKFIMEPYDAILGGPLKKLATSRSTEAMKDTAEAVGIPGLPSAASLVAPRTSVVQVNYQPLHRSYPASIPFRGNRLFGGKDASFAPNADLSRQNFTPRDHI
ncbi:MAG: hypothetical protein KTR14_02660 [Vampirovibrio sp.]|nr:hypothetical protein [Vampirovibrio sp.]